MTMASTPITNGLALGFHSSNVTTPDRDNGSVAEVDSELAILSKRHDQFAMFDAEKAKFTRASQPCHSCCISINSDLRSSCRGTNTCTSSIKRSTPSASVSIVG
jgi:hypothetical protein